MSLYRKYRPKDFPSLVGQDHIKTTLLNAIKARKLAHAYLFTGPRGTGKTTTARLLAKAVNSTQMSEDGNFDNCEFAAEIDAGRLIDVIEIDAASNRGIDEIRDLREKINYSPTRAPNKVYIIDEVHMLTKEAFNALLKTLEEPPSFVYFILATTEIQKVPETIISRCQRFDFKRISENDLVARLKFVAESEEIRADEDALKIIAKQARGGLRDALTMMEQLVNGNKLEADYVQKVLGLSNAMGVDNTYQLMLNGQSLEAVQTLKKLHEQGTDLVNFNKEILEFLRGKLMESLEEGKSGEVSWLLQTLENFQEAYEKQKFSYIPELPLEIAIIKSSKTRQTQPKLADGNNSSASSQGEEAKKKSELKVEEAVKIPEAKIVEVEKPVAESIVIAEEKIELEEVQLGNSLDVKISEIEQKWSRIVGRIENTVAKRCLMAGKPLQLEGGNLTIGFSSNFSKDKLFVPELLQVSEQAILEEMGVKITLKGMVDEKLAILHSNSFKKEEAPMPSAPSAPANNMLGSALNVFGGEVVG
ncbi:MAG: DNA polymerase III subunit gamma/tau [Candidatus Altimarinota bacterium]